ncbi:DUF2207 domain-containing protein, partial [Bacillus sp. JJ1764]|uniref:DUF2207 domain-containing protein n=1 Tax=Bacillus sp. JJ1764 TaxID=3122964 RepID=UPI0030008436
MKKWLSCFLLLALLIVFPTQGLAVEYSITKVKMDAYLQENGTVKVVETYTYDFDGDFHGITRELIPKKGTSITDFSADERGKSLRVEKKDGLYKVYRKGSDERITVTLHYTIKNGVEVYRDVAQFYWPFFDDRNESAYENLTITIHPPKATEDVIAFGYDEAYATEKVKADGTVVFNMGNVPSSTNGDIRVAYDSSLFSTASITADKSMKASILKAKQKLIDDKAAQVKAKNWLAMVGGVGIPVFSIVLLLLIGWNWKTARAKRSGIRQEGFDFVTLPNLIMSLPATIYFTNRRSLPPQAMAAALLDLIRQGYANQTSSELFVLTGKKSKRKHEKVLMDWLFNKIGANKQFTFDDLSNYTKDSKNHNRYNSFQTSWRDAVREEVDSLPLYEKKTRYRMMVGFSSLLLLPFIVLFLVYEMYGSFFAVLILFLTVIFYAIAYRPLTWEGARMSLEWREFKDRFNELPQEEWEKWSEDDQMKAYIYGLGMNSKAIIKKNDDLIDAFTPPNNSYTEYAGIYS